MSDYKLASGRAVRINTPTVSHDTAGFILPDGTRFTVGNTVTLSAPEIASPTAAILADTTATYIGPSGERYYSNGVTLVLFAGSPASNVQAVTTTGVKTAFKKAGATQIFVALTTSNTNTAIVQFEDSDSGAAIGVFSYPQGAGRWLSVASATVNIRPNVLSISGGTLTITTSGSV